jgi:hypothetical protein
MAVEYEWDFDAEAPSEEPPPSDHRRPISWRTPLIVAAAVILVAGLAYVAVWRLRRTSIRRATADVLSAVELELRALEAEDDVLYMGMQDETDESWVEAQQERLTRGNALPPPAPGLTASSVLTVEKPAIFGDRAQVPLVRLAGPPGGPQYLFRSIGFYRLLPDGRWVHTAPDPEYARRALAWVGPRNELAGYMAETDLLEQLAPDLELTADAFCALFTCAPDLRFRLALTDTLGMGTLSGGSLPAPHLAGVPVGEDATALWNWAMARHLVDLMITQVAGDRAGGFITDALRAQVKVYLSVGIPHQVDPTRLAEALEAGRLPSLAELWDGAGADGDRALAADAAAVLVRFVEQEYGREGVLSLLSAASRAPDAISLFAIAFGSDASVIELRWLEYFAREVVPAAALPVATA